MAEGMEPAIGDADLPIAGLEVAALTEDALVALTAADGDAALGKEGGIGGDEAGEDGQADARHCPLN
jgi:hypothetical protein